MARGQVNLECNSSKESRLIIIMATCIVLLVFGVFANLAQQVDPGFRVKSTTDNNWKVTKSHYTNLDVGTEIEYLNINGTLFAIQPEWLKPSMVTVQNETEFDRFIQGEAFLYRAIDSKVALVDVDGEHYEIAFKPRSVLNTSLYFWLHPVLALLSVVMALWALWMGEYNKYHVVNILASVCFMASLVLAVSALDRAWAINPDNMKHRFYFGNFCMRLFTSGYLYLMWCVPYEIGKGKWTAHLPMMLCGIYITTWCVQLSGWYQNFNYMFIKVMFVGGVMAVVSIFIQWYLSSRSVQKELVNQIALRWMAATIAVSCVLGFGYNLLWQQGYADGSEADLINSSITLMFKMGITALLLKHLLYKFETWWWRAWGIFGGLTLGLLVLLLSAEWFFGYSKKALSVAGVGFLVGYFFIGNYFRYRYAKHDAKVMERSVPQLVKVATSFDEPKKAHLYWCDVLEKTFHPLYIQTDVSQNQHIGDTQRVDIDPTKWQGTEVGKVLADSPVRILQNGEQMLVHGLYGEMVLLSGAASGMRLFTQRDVERASLFWQIASQGLLTQQAFIQGKSSERKRIAADLHDDIGGKLLYLSSVDGKFGNYAHDTLEDLRTLTRGLSSGDKILADLVADINYILAERCEVQGVDYQSEFDIDSEAEKLVSARGATMFSSIMSELLRNALQHEGTRNVYLSVMVLQNQLCIELENDGATTEPATWELGLGTISIKRRINDVNGDILWSARQGGGVICTASWDMTTWLAFR